MQWWECFPPTPPTTVNWVQILDLASHVDLVRCWFLSLLQGVFSGSSSFPLSAKYQHSKFQFDLTKVDRKSHPMDCPMLKSSYLFFCVPPSMQALPCLGPVTIYIMFLPPSVPLKTMRSPLHSFFPPPPSMINNDRCFGFNFPWAERSNFTSSAQRTCLQHLVSGKLSLFFHFFFWLLLFLFLISVLFLFLCFFYCVVLMPFYPNLCMYL